MRAEYQKRLVQIAEIFEGIAAHATESARERCPYKNRRDECTAAFGCRNQRKPPVAGGLMLCRGDDKLDYRGAWQTS
ncbi:MAG: hypothetical protein EXQ52_01405 [Bryobacterales bacterium]|nr:hypothetical protein [Bryobacterales bacterium]